ncbi:hypothetical protein F4819DRAFT_497311 [Hypoxylon fuscum]|nr:hypothetical protein F4819DRAFT_497311 [Hypoxylon fuscum]
MMNLPPGVSADYLRNIPNCPPPGLVRAMAPVPISEHQYRREVMGRRRCALTNDDVAMFSDIAEYLETGLDIYGNRIILSLSCLICGDKYLDLPSIVSPRLSAEDIQDYTELMTVLPCSHILGAKCFDSWCETRKDQNLHPECPFCRYPLIHQECGHNIQIRQYDPRFPRQGQLPLTITEGGFVPDYCYTCRRDHQRMEATAMVEATYPQDVPGYAFVDQNQCSTEEFRYLRQRMWDDLCEAFHWGENRFHHW